MSFDCWSVSENKLKIKTEHKKVPEPFNYSIGLLLFNKMILQEFIDETFFRSVRNWLDWLSTWVTASATTSIPCIVIIATTIKVKIPINQYNYFHNILTACGSRTIMLAEHNIIRLFSFRSVNSFPYVSLPALKRVPKMYNA